MDVPRTSRFGRPLINKFKSLSDLYDFDGEDDVGTASVRRSERLINKEVFRRSFSHLPASFKLYYDANGNCMADGLGPEYQPVVHLEKLTVQQLAAVGNCNWQPVVHMERLPEMRAFRVGSPCPSDETLSLQDADSDGCSSEGSEEMSGKRYSSSQDLFNFSPISFSSVSSAVSEELVSSVGTLHSESEYKIQDLDRPAVEPKRNIKFEQRMLSQLRNRAKHPAKKIKPITEARHFSPILFPDLSKETDSEQETTEEE